jgi:hypothetical protein
MMASRGEGNHGEMYAGGIGRRGLKGSRRFFYLVHEFLLGRGCARAIGAEMTTKSNSDKRVANAQESTTTTYGENFSDGTQIELVRPDPRKEELALLVSKEAIVTETLRVQHDAVSYVPVEPDASVLHAMYIPSGVSEYGTTCSLFAEILRVFTSRANLSNTTAALLAHFVFSTWFADCFSTAPRMLIFGPPEESATLLQLLAATCRRALLLSDVTIATWSPTLAALRPTLLINTHRLRPSTREFLEASNTRHEYLPRKGQLLDLFGAQVIHERTPSGDPSMHESAICVTATPARGQLPIVTDQDRTQLANEFQQKLLLYRLRHYSEVRESEFDVPEFTTAVRSRARMLGACVVDTPEVQSGLISVLRHQDDDARITRSFSLESVLVEALFVMCHEKETRVAATVGEIAETMTVIFQGRGEALKLEPRKVGEILRGLQFYTARQGSAARGIALLEADRRRVHQLARDYDVPAIRNGFVGCSQCDEADLAKTGDGFF